MVDGSTRVVGIIGGPDQVRGSLSPRIHNAAFRALGMGWIYLPFPVTAEVETALRGLAAAGVHGVNVTMPHKLEAARVCDRLVGTAATVRAANTVEVRDGRLVGHNTDGEGLIRFLRRDAGLEVSGATVLIAGAGGAARAIVAALAGAGAAEIAVAGREARRVEELRDLSAGARFDAVQLAALSADRVGSADLIVNATPVGSADEPPVVPAEWIRPGVTVVDLTYLPPSTRLLREAREHGAIAHNGLGMLLHQAAMSFEIWTGVQPPIDEMSAAALRELSATLKRPTQGAD
ncbi:MAG: shikimate dehydrogenase [Actinomycetota bacterium]